MCQFSFSTFLRNIFLSLLLTLSLLLNPCHAEPARTIRVGVYEAGLLANFNKDGSAHGFFVDMLNSIAVKEQWNVQYVPGSWQEGLDRLKNDNIDLVLCIGYTAEREKYMDFPKEYLLLNWGVLYRPKGSQITSLLELEGKSVSALKGDVYLTGFLELVKQFNVHVEIQEVDKYSKVFKAVESGAVAAGVAGNLYGILNEDGRRAEQTPVIFSPVKVGYAVKDGKNGDLIAALDRNIAEMKADKASVYHRELEKLMSKKGLKIPREAYWIFSGVAAALLLSVVFIVLLRRQVKSKTAHLLVEIDQRKKTEEALLSLKDELQEQNEELQVNEEEMRVQNDHLLATEEMLRAQISDYEIGKKLLKESYERFRALHEASFGGVFVHENGVILECNQGLSEMTGYSVEELIGMQSIQLIPEEYQEEVAIKIREGFSELYEVEGIRKDGTRYHVRIRGKSIFYMGRSVRVTDMRDITDRKLAEEEHKQLEHKFRNWKASVCLQAASPMTSTTSLRSSWGTATWPEKI